MDTAAQPNINLNQPVPESVQPPDSPDLVHEIPKPKNTFTLIVVILLLLTSISSFIYWVYLKNHPQSPSGSNLTNQETEWNTYFNTEYGFSFKYPTSFVEDQLPQNLPDNPDLILATFQNTQNASSIAIFLDRHAFDNDYLKIYAPTGSENIPPQEKIFGDNLFYYYGEGGGGVNYPDQFFYDLGGKILIIRYYGPYTDSSKTPSKETKDTENQMLASFQKVL